jgi:ankyrin repeat protein
MRSSVETVKFLLQSGADPNAAMKQSGQTPLMMCAMSLSLPKARLLLEYGGSVDARDSAGNDLLWYAQFYKGDNQSQ